MFRVITGGSGSGKSAYAEQCVLDLGPAERIYVATMYPYDEECHARIARHRQEQGAGEGTVEAVTAGIDSLLGQAGHLVVVTNEIFSDGLPYDEETARYLRYLGEINARMGYLADAVTEVVCGIPLIIK